MVMKLKKFNDSKSKLAVYARVSTSKQDIEKQVAIGLELAEKLGFAKEEVMVKKDRGVSSLQVKLENRVGMTELLRSMKNKEFDILIVFDRDRLARNMVEYLVIIEEAIKHNIEIVFSNSEAEPFTNKLDVEADLALYAEMEGKKINQRTAAVRKYYPSAPYGYMKEGKRSDTEYVQNEKDIEQVKIMFREFENIKNKSDFIQFKKGWETKKGINCKKILMNHFYAGVIIYPNDIIEPLNHIKGIVRKETIFENRQNMAHDWDIFQEQKYRKIWEILQPDAINILDLSVISQGRYGLRNLVVAVLANFIFQVCTLSRRREELGLQTDVKKVWMVIDEAHNFCPRGKSTLSKEILIRWAKEGRQPGLSLVVASQQPSAIDNEILTQCGIRIVLRITSKDDYRVDALSQDFLAGGLQPRIQKLNGPGETLIIDDERESVVSVRVRPRQSWHGGGSA